MHDHDCIVRAITANTAAVTSQTEVNLALLRFFQSQVVNRSDLREMEARMASVISGLTAEVRGMNNAAIRRATEKLDTSGNALAQAVAENQPTSNPTST